MMTACGPDHTKRKHAKLSASSAERWFNCPGSVRLSEGIPSTSSIYADEGTAAHELAEWCLTVGREPTEYNGSYIIVENEFIDITEEMVGAVGLYVDTVHEIAGPIRQVGVRVNLEQRLDLSAFYPGLFGTADCVIYDSDKRKLTVIDFKYGKGVPVEAVGNKQLLYYALGAALSERRPLDEIEILVVQPRAPHKDGPVRGWTIKADDLMDFAADLVAAAKATAAPDAPLNPGDWCKFCPAAGTCPALLERVYEVAGAEFDAVDAIALPGPDITDADTLSDILTHADLIETWLKAVRAHAFQEAQHGRPPTGFKLVLGREGNRQWTDEHKALYALLERGLDDNEVFAKQVVKSPAQIAKIVEIDEELQKLITRSPGKPTLVPESDPREPVTPEAVAQFTAIGE